MNKKSGKKKQWTVIIIKRVKFMDLNEWPLVSCGNLGNITIKLFVCCFVIVKNSFPYAPKNIVF